MVVSSSALALPALTIYLRKANRIASRKCFYDDQRSPRSKGLSVKTLKEILPCNRTDQECADTFAEELYRLNRSFFELCSPLSPRSIRKFLYQYDLRNRTRPLASTGDKDSELDY